MAIEIKISIIDGFKINPNNKTVNKIFKVLAKNNGHCLTKVENRYGNDLCPCSEYLQNKQCYCGLYIKKYDTNN